MSAARPVTPEDSGATASALAERLGRIDRRLAAAFSRVTEPLMEAAGTGAVVSCAAGVDRLCRDRPDTIEIGEAFIAAAPPLWQRLDAGTIERLVDLLCLIPPRPAVAARGALDAALAVLPGLTPEVRGSCLEASAAIARRNPWSMGQFFELVAVPLQRLAPDAARAFLGGLAPLGGLTPLQLTTLLKDAAAVPAAVPVTQLGALLTLAAGLAARSPAAAQELLRSAEPLCARLGPDQLAAWSRRGEDLLGLHPAAALSYYRLQSRLAQDVLAEHSSGVALSDVRDVLRLYCQALMGRSLSVLSTEQLQAGHAGWAGGEALSSEGAAIFAPPLLREFPDKRSNFEGYKVLATHQAGHLLFDTYDFAFDSPGALLGSLRPLAHQRSGSEASFDSDFERFFDLFSNRRLARDLFALAEDERVDAAVVREYRGIRHPYGRVQAGSLVGRPEVHGLPIQFQLLETLMRHSLQPEAVVRMPRSVVPNLDRAVRVLNLMADPTATTMDATEAAMRLYVWVSQVPNVPARMVLPEHWVDHPLPRDLYDPAEEDLTALAHAFARANPLEVPGTGEGRSAEGDEEAPFVPPPPVSYRADPRPEAMQELLKHLEQEGDVSGAGASLDEIAMELLREMVAPDDGFGESLSEMHESEAVNPNPQWNRTYNKSGRQGGQTSPLVESVAEADVQVFHYDEWDYRIRAYRPGWCRVNQRTLKEGAEEFYERTISQHYGLVAALRKQFEMLRPEGITKVKRLVDGEEFDLDAVVESVVDKRAGHGLHDKVYWRRLKSERSVAVAFLLDMSLSTDERVDQDLRQYAPLATGPNDPVNSPYRRPGSGKRIIDLEKEGLVLLIEALERLGDTYGIYGFSSSGRGDVQYFVVKETGEDYSSHVRGRLDKIVPLQGTRMGAAVRHTTSKLEKLDARTKVLLMLSDGRPQDRDYGTLPWELEEPHRERSRPSDPATSVMGADGVMTDEKEYAVHDTKTAFNEAKAKGITPFCISIDKSGHDYLKAMCGDIGYEVVSEIESLPRRVPALYRRLTT